ncbi:putative cyclin-B3-1 isoform X2 [Cornus florida]|uniref:putative cyclin-B3-1 isoform X2 n=1 Tax=Cornus florida TaxID=4283 RepID=UPI0028A0F104|nr:putative cyclin-B3-1 isoform X2 [Cornus florida]
MVSVKGKLNKTANRVTTDHGTSKSDGIRNFKVYEENDKVKVKVQRSESVYPESKMKSVPVEKGITQINASDSKGCLKNLDKSKGKHVKPNVGRKVLADVSNVHGNISSNEVHDGSKPVKGKSERITSLQRVLVGPGIRIASSTSSKTLVGKVRANQSQAVGHSNTLKRGVKDFKVSSDDQQTNGQGYRSADTDGRTTARNLLPQTRKSLPVLKRVHQMNTTGVKENAGNSEKDKGKYGFPVKPKVGRKVVPQASNGRSHLWNNRVSDGFIIMASKGQSKETLSRKSVKPFVKTAVIVPNTRRTSKTKLVSEAAMSSKIKEEVMTSSLTGNIASIVPHEQPAQRGFPSDGKSNIGTDVTDIVTTRRSACRKSYTSLLMAGPKLLEDHCGVMKQENLPSVYDDGNHLEVAEYVDDIYQYYWVMEAQSQSLANYMSIQTGITPQMRGILINWLIEVHSKFDLMQETLYLSVTLLDRYLSLAVINKNEMQLVGLTALLLASKYEDFWHPRVRDLISISAEPYTRDQMLLMEKAILKKLKFRLNAPTAYVFMLRFLKAAQSDAKLEHLAFYLIELCLVEYEALKFKPSLLCASAIYLARLTLQTIPSWTLLLSKNTRYEESQIRDCAEMILRFHKAAGTAMLKVTYEKYKGLDYSGVTAIEPLDRLPLST